MTADETFALAPARRSGAVNGHAHVRYWGAMRRCPQPGSACPNSYTPAPTCPGCDTPTVPLTPGG